MQIAVSSLSPVNIQILIPAFLAFSRDWHILSYNLSSTPVIPKNSMSVSRSDTTYNNFLKIVKNYYTLKILIIYLLYSVISSN